MPAPHAVVPLALHGTLSEGPHCSAQDATCQTQLHEWKQWSERSGAAAHVTCAWPLHGIVSPTFDGAHGWVCPCTDAEAHAARLDVAGAPDIMRGRSTQHEQQ